MTINSLISSNEREILDRLRSLSSVYSLLHTGVTSYNDSSYKTFSVLSLAGSDIETVTATISLVRSRNICHRPSDIGGFSGTFSENPAFATAIFGARDSLHLLNRTARFERAPTFQRV